VASWVWQLSTCFRIVPHSAFVSLAQARSQRLQNDIRHEAGFCALMRRVPQMAHALGMTASGDLLLRLEKHDLVRHIHRYNGGLPTSVVKVSSILYQVPLNSLRMTRFVGSSMRSFAASSLGYASWVMHRLLEFAPSFFRPRMQGPSHRHRTNYYIILELLWRLNMRLSQA